MNKVGLQGEYRIEVRGGDGQIRQETDWFDNLILNQGLDRLGTSGTVKFNRAVVGTGTIAPDETQIALQAQIAASATSTSPISSTNSGAPLYETQLVYSYAFTQGAVVGNISEIGVAWDTTNLFSRALIVDGGGSPISITLTAIDQLTVYYRLTLRPTLTDTTGVVDISGTPYNYTARAAQVGSFFTSPGSLFGGTDSNLSSFSTCGASGSTGWWGVRGTGSTLGSITGSITGGTQVGGSSSSTFSSYTPGTYYRDSTLSLPIASGNASGGIVTLWSYWSSTDAQYQWQFSPAIPKDNTKILTLTFRFGWSRL